MNFLTAKRLLILGAAKLNQQLTYILHLVLIPCGFEEFLYCFTGGRLCEISKLSSMFGGVIPVRSGLEDLELLDLAAPFLVRGKVCHYGCVFLSSIWELQL